MAQDPADTVLAHWREAGAETGTLTQGPPPFFPEPPDDGGDGDRHGDDDGRPGPPLSNARLGMLMFLGAETMLFAGLIGSFLVFRVANQMWPPPTLPSLSAGVTGINTLILLCSAITMWCAQRAVHTEQRQSSVRFLGSTVFLGVAFLVVQGYEWVQLIGYGLTMASGVYGATFFVLIGCHGLHVFGAVVWLLIGLVYTCKGRYSTTRYTGLALCGMYWYYVVALWPILYWLVYLY